MDTINPFVQKVLDAIVPEREKQTEWLTAQQLAPVSQSEGMLLFKKRLEQAFERDEKVLVAGDYDCDGMMATSILVDGLKAMDIQTGFYIPNRVQEGYGLSVQTVQMAKDRGYSLIITVDNGVSSEAALRKARELEMDVIVSDHHEFVKQPDCFALIHPSTLEPVFSTLCGAALAYEMLRVLNAERPYHLQWAAVASLGDCVPVSGQTRTIIQKGMEEMEKELEPHLQILAGKEHFSQEDISFQIVPRINTVGRLADVANANNFVRFLLNSNPRQMQLFQNQIEELNTKRKEMTSQHVFLAQSRIRPYHPVLISCEEEYHPGIIGIVAGQLCESFQKPVIIASLQDGLCKASMRSPAGFHCVEFLRHFDHYLALGGHEQAAGFTVSEQHWPEFVSYCLNQARTYEWKAEDRNVLDIFEEDITLENVQALDQLRPFGPGFEMPLLRLRSPRIRSRFDLSQGKHRKYTLKSGIQCLNFNQSQQDLARKNEEVKHFLGSVQLNEYQNRKSVNFIIRGIGYGGEQNGSD